MLTLLPGLDGTGALFGPLLEALPPAIRAEVIAYPPDRILSLPEHAHWVLKRLPQEGTVLVAESFSGLVALALLALAPSRFRSVVFVGAFAEPPRPLLLRMAPVVPRPGALIRSIPSFLLRQYCLGPKATVAEINRVRDAIGTASPEVLAHRLSLIASRHAFGTARFRGSCRYIQATGDRLVPERCARWFRQRFETFELTRVDGPHFLLQMRPEACAQVLAQAAREAV